MSELSYFDRQMAARKAERSTQAELDQLQAGTDAINKGLGNGGLWLLVMAGFIGMPFTGGASLIVSIIAGIAMNGGPKNMVAGAMPLAVDVAAPKAGCMRIVASLATILLVIILCVFVALLVAFNGGLIG